MTRPIFFPMLALVTALSLVLAASAQMLAIAVVVAALDYISSVLREKYV